MKEKGFEKPVKYIFVGEPNTTKTTLAKKLGMKYFETDSLKEEQILNPECYPKDVDVIIVGGKWIKRRHEIINMLLEHFKDFQLMLLNFESLGGKVLKIVIEKAKPREYSDEGYDVFLTTEDRILQVFLDNEDGYRSRAEVIPDEEVDGFKFWLKMEGGKTKVHNIEYDEIEYDKTEGDINYIIRAKLRGEVVFKVGTNDEDSYYPCYFINVKGKEDISELTGEES